MAEPSGTFDTFAAIGVREDLEDIIYDISPLETPFLSNAARMKATNTFHEWQTDALAGATTNAQIMGNDAITNTAVPTVRLKNYTQILSKSPIVAGTLEAVNKAGRDSEMAYQMAKRSKELKRDLEQALITNQGSTGGAAGTSAALLASVESWIATNKTTAGSSSATTPGYASGTVLAPTDSTSSSVNESMLKAVIAAVWTSGGDPTTLMVGPKTKQAISSHFTGIATRYRMVPPGEQADVISGVDLYISDFGEHRVVPNRFMRDQNILCLDMDYWGVAYLRPFQSWDLAKTGDAIKRQIVCEVTLISKNQLASGKVTDISPSVS